MDLALFFMIFDTVPIFCSTHIWWYCLFKNPSLVLFFLFWPNPAWHAFYCINTMVYAVSAFSNNSFFRERRFRKVLKTMLNFISNFMTFQDLFGIKFSIDLLIEFWWKMRPNRLPFHIKVEGLLITLWLLCPRVDFCMHFGRSFAHFWFPFVSPSFTLGSPSLPFASLWLPFGSHRSPWTHFWRPSAPSSFSLVVRVGGNGRKASSIY